MPIIEAETMTSNPQKITLNAYVQRKIEEHKDNPFQTSPFGFDVEGNYINNWMMNYQSIIFFTGYRGLSDFSSVVPVAIYVPSAGPVSTGLSVDGQPFGWDGKINEHTAELALWWAFDVLTAEEAREIMCELKPVVIFKYLEKGMYHTLTVRCEANQWLVVDEN
jgi:hypothetical protein